MKYVVSGSRPCTKEIEEIGILFGWEKRSGVLNIEVKESKTNSCNFDGQTLRIGYISDSYIFRCLGELQYRNFLPFTMEEECSFHRMGPMIDCSRNGVYTLTSLKRIIKYLAVCGYNLLEIYTEDTYQIDGEPYFGYLRGAYSKKQLKELDGYAKRFGIELVPCIQTLAHLGTIFRWKKYSEIHDVNDILLAGDENTYALIDKMFATMRECFSTDLINIGMDEAFMLGLGEYYRKNGIVDRFEIMFSHLNRVLAIAEKYHFRCSMWSDMYYRLAFGGYYSEEYCDFPEEILQKVPKDISLIYWDYYSKSQEHFQKIISQHKKFDNEIWYAGFFCTFLGFLPNNDFSIQSANAAIKACNEENIKNILFTMWGDNGSECSAFSVLPSIVSVAEYAYGNKDEASIKLKFEALFGIQFDAFMLLDEADKIGNITGADLTDPSKYLLYNDCFAGVLDTTISLVDGGEYWTLAEKLSPYTEHSVWGNLFAFAKNLASVLEYKATIGIRTREAYRRFKEGDVEPLSSLIRQDYEILIERLEKLYDSFEILWHSEKRANSFEISNYRLGGLIARVKYCKKRLSMFFNGDISEIEELEEKLLDYYCGKEYTKGLGYINEFQKIASVNNF